MDLFKKVGSSGHPTEIFLSSLIPRVNDVIVKIQSEEDLNNCSLSCVLQCLKNINLLSKYLLIKNDYSDIRVYLSMFMDCFGKLFRD